MIIVEEVGLFLSTKSNAFSVLKDFLAVVKRIFGRGGEGEGAETKDI